MCECSCWWHWASGKQSLHWHVVLCGLGALLCTQRTWPLGSPHRECLPLHEPLKCSKSINAAAAKRSPYVQQCGYGCNLCCLCMYIVISRFLVPYMTHCDHSCDLGMELGTVEPQFPTYVPATVSTLQPSSNVFFTLSTLVTPTLIAFPWPLIFAWMLPYSRPTNAAIKGKFLIARS